MRDRLSEYLKLGFTEEDAACQVRIDIYWERRKNLAYARQCKAEYAAERKAHPEWAVRPRKPRRKADVRQLELPLAV